MAALRIKRKLAAMARKRQENPSNNQLQNSASPGITQDYIAQVSEEIEGRVTKKLSREFSRTEFRILGALLNEFLLNPQIRTFSGTTPEAFWKTRNQAGIVPRVIPILKWSSLPVVPAI